MNRQKWLLMLLSLVLMAGTAGFLAQLRTHQKLGAPGVKTRPLGNGPQLEVMLPERVLDYESESIPLDAVTTNMLPKDTSFGQRHYQAPDNSWINLSVVLMGSDRTSIHKPQFCLEGAGWHIDDAATVTTSLRVERPSPYDLPIVKLIATKPATLDGQPVTARTVFVYWFVADDALTASILGFQRNWWMARNLLTKGVLQRWAYVICQAVCWPGQEEATFERMKKFIAASAPEFQLTPGPRPATVTARQ
jgi:hypothetical protein